MWFHKGPLSLIWQSYPFQLVGWLLQFCYAAGENDLVFVCSKPSKCVHQLNKFHHLGRVAAMHCIGDAAKYSTL